MDISRFQHADSTVIAASPADVYAVVSDVTRIGELSPVCASGAWEDGASATAGSWFVGHNAIGEFTWDTRCRVEVAEPGKEFAFVNGGANGDVELVRWGYTLREVPEGTEVTETWKVLPDYVDFAASGGGDEAAVEANIEGMAAMARDGMATTLANLKKVIEG